MAKRPRLEPEPEALEIIEAEEQAEELEPVEELEQDAIEEETNEEKSTKSVKFLRDFNGSLNDYSIKVSKHQLNEVFELPLVVYDWIQKFGVCKDA